MGGSLLGMLRRLFWITVETTADIAEAYWEILIKSSVMLGIYLLAELILFGLFLGKFSALMAIAMAFTFTAWAIVALPVIVFAIAISRISFVGKIFEAIFIIVIFGFGISLLMIKGHLWEYPTISWMLLLASFVMVIGQVFTIGGFAGHIVTACTLTFVIIACVAVPIIMFVPTQIQSSVASRATDAQYRMLGADQNIITTYLCEDNGLVTVCDSRTRKRLRLRRANGEPAVYTAFYDGQTEFYDNPGPHPIMDRELRKATEDDMDRRKRELVDQKNKEKQKSEKEEQQKLQEQRNQEIQQKTLENEEKKIQQEVPKETKQQRNIDNDQAPQLPLPTPAQLAAQDIRETKPPSDTATVISPEYIVSLPSMTNIIVRATQEVTDTNVQEGDIFYFPLDKDVRIYDEIVFQRDATVELEIVRVDQKTRTTDALLIIKINKIGGMRITATTRSVEPRRDRVKSGTIGAAVGGLFGAIIGGKTGAVIGAGAGGATGASVAHKADTVRIKIGDKIEFQVR